MAPKQKRTKRPVEETKLYQKRQAALTAQKNKRAKRLAALSVAHQASKLAVEKMAEESFGEGGLTPDRQEALAAIVLGEGGQSLTITSPAALRHFINKARKKFFEHAERYVDTHIKAVEAAYADGEYEVAGRLSQWAMENLGDAEERVVTKPAKENVAPQTVPIMVGVSLGGSLQK